MSLESTPPTSTSLTPRTARGARSPSRPLIKFDLSNSSSFLDKGLDAINGVGKLVEGFAVTLDTVIGQAFDEWGATPRPSKTPVGKNKPVGTSAARSTTKPSLASAGGSGPATPQAPQEDAWGDFEVDDSKEDSGFEDVGLPKLTRTATKEVSSKPRQGSQPPIVPTLNLPGISPAPVPSVAQGDSAKEILQWRRRAQILQKELRKLRAQKEEYQKVREEYDALQKKLEDGTMGLPAPTVTPGKSALEETPMLSPSITSPDPLAAEQVMRQMEALLAEKARLTQENDRLLRENTGLHELLEYTMHQHVTDEEDEEEIFSSEGGAEGESSVVTEEESFKSSGGTGDVMIEEGVEESASDIFEFGSSRD